VRQFIRPVGVDCSCCRNISPDLNPIERDFVKLEHLERKVSARTLDGVGPLLDAYTPRECANIVG
jgi:transposase